MRKTTLTKKIYVSKTIDNVHFRKFFVMKVISNEINNDT